MNDLEICKRIAEIEGEEVSVRFEWNDSLRTALHYGTECEDRRPEYNPLTDDALFLKLEIKHGVVVFHRYENDVLICWAESSDGTGAIGKPIFSPAGQDLEAVKMCGCLAIIEMHK